MCINIEFVDL